MKKRLNVLSLFANIGFAEADLREIGVDVVVANELEPRRAKLYQQIYPDCDMICGDITKKSRNKKLLSKSTARCLPYIGK